jgi:hypothetical protein
MAMPERLGDCDRMLYTGCMPPGYGGNIQCNKLSVARLAGESYELGALTTVFQSKVCAILASSPSKDLRLLNLKSI